MDNKERIARIEAELESAHRIVADLLPFALMGMDLQDLLEAEKDLASVGQQSDRDGLMSELRKIVDEHRPMSLDEFKKLVRWHDPNWRGKQ